MKSFLQFFTVPRVWARGGEQIHGEIFSNKYFTVSLLLNKNEDLTDGAKVYTRIFKRNQKFLWRWNTIWFKCEKWSQKIVSFVFSKLFQYFNVEMVEFFLLLIWYHIAAQFSLKRLQWLYKASFMFSARFISSFTLTRETKLKEIKYILEDCEHGTHINKYKK